MILNMSLVLNALEFWIYQGSEYASNFEYVRIECQFWMCQGYTRFRICLNNWICLNIPDYVCICLNMPDSARICVNMPKSFWMAFWMTFPNFRICFTNLFLLEHVVTYLKVYRILEVIVWIYVRLFSWRDKKIFFYRGWKYFICFLFWTKYFYK